MHHVEGLAARGYSDAVITALSRARASSTNRVYDSKWKLFKQFCSDRSVRPESADPATVAEFLLFLFRSRNCAAGTIASYRAAVGNVLRFTNSYDPAQDPVISQLLKGFRRERGPVDRTVPRWDLSVVLRFLAAKGGEDDDLHTATAKVAFLLSLATAGRCHSLAALENDVDISGVSPRSLSISYHCSYVPKQFYRLKHPMRIVPVGLTELPPGSPPGTCPVRCLLAYLNRVESVRQPSQTSLLIPHDLTKHTRVHPAAIGRYVVKTITLAYDHAGVPCPAGVRAHDVRGIATSLRALTGVALSDVLAAGQWSQADTFTRFYLKEFPHCHLRALRDAPVFAAAGGLLTTSSLSLQNREGRSERTTEEAT